MGKQGLYVDETSEEGFLLLFCFVNNQCVVFAVLETQRESNGIICLLCACLINGVIH